MKKQNIGFSERKEMVNAKITSLVPEVSESERVEDAMKSLFSHQGPAIFEINTDPFLI